MTCIAILSPTSTSQKTELQAELKEKENGLLRLQVEQNKLHDELQRSRKRLKLQSDKEDQLTAKVTTLI